MRSLKFAGTLLLSLLLVSSVSEAKPNSYKETRLLLDPYAKGGEVKFFLDVITYARINKVRFELWKECWSSCTLLTALIKDGLVCARPGTNLFFHQFVEVTDMVIEGNILKSFKIKGQVTGAKFDRIWQTYPLHIRKAIMRSPTGGLPPHGQEWAVSARDLGVPAC